MLTVFDFSPALDLAVHLDLRSLSGLLYAQLLLDEGKGY